MCNLIACIQATRQHYSNFSNKDDLKFTKKYISCEKWKVALEMLNQAWGVVIYLVIRWGLQSNIARDIRFKPCDSFQTLSFVFYYGRFQQRGSVGQNRMICLSFALLYDQFPPFWLLRLPPWPIISTFIAASHFHCSGQITNISNQNLSKIQMWTIWARGLS